MFSLNKIHEKKNKTISYLKINKRFVDSQEMRWKKDTWLRAVLGPGIIILWSLKLNRK